MYAAVEDAPVIALHPALPSQRCPVGRGIRSALTPVYAGLEEAVRSHLARTTVADVLRDSLAG